MNLRDGFLKRSVVSTVDQAVLSGLNFAVGLALIQLSSKDVYGLFSMLFSAGMLCTTLMDAVVGSAVTTMSSSMESTARHRFTGLGARIQWLLASLMACFVSVVAAICALQTNLDEPPLFVGLAFGLFVLGFGIREYCRSTLFVEGDALGVARLDTSFALLVLISGAIYQVIFSRLSVSGAMLILAWSNGLVCMPSCVKLWNAGFKPSRLELLQVAKQLWSIGRWALAGTIVGWVGNNVYVYLAVAYVGIEASADLNSSRMLLAPAGLLSAAWIKVARPVAGRLIAQQDWPALKRFSFKSGLTLCTLNLGFVSVLLIALPWLLPNLLGAKYEKASFLVPLWGVYFLITSARDVGTTLLTAFGSFMALFKHACVSLVILLIACFAFMPAWGTTGALVAMIVVEVYRLAFECLYLLPRSRNKLQNITN